MYCEEVKRLGRVSRLIKLSQQIEAVYLAGKHVFGNNTLNDIFLQAGFSHS